MSSEAPRWDLESVFAGGSKSEEYKKYRQNVKVQLNDLEKKFSKFRGEDVTISDDALHELINELQTLYHRVELVYAFSGCLISADVADDSAYQIYNEAQSYESQWNNLKTSLEGILLGLDENRWKAFLARDDIQRIGFFLDEIRDLARRKMPPEMESFALDLSVNGYHAWNNIYTKMAGETTVEFIENGKPKTMSLGQIALKMSSPDRTIRKQAFEKLTEAWKGNASLASIMLNSQAGFRLSLYKHRNWDSALFEPLQMNRLREESLTAMWDSVLEYAPRFNGFIKAKMKLLGIHKFCWYDQNAPVGKSSRTWTFDEAGKFIVEQMRDFSPELSDFAKNALAKRWVEAENRPGKAAGGFCTGLGEVKESRIFMTFENSYDSLLTLAHELGHAYHHYLLKDEPAFATFYTLGLAETASTFNELLVTDAALSNAEDPQEKIMLLDQKLSNGFIMFCNIHSRFLFDKSFYEEREEAVVPRDRLNELMIAAQKKAYCGTLDEKDGLHPEFWASKLHFFETSAPFYNFPYTFGFMFSNAVYNKAKEDGSSFSEKYKALLMDTGVMTSEEIAQKHLGFDLTDRKFWNRVCEKVVEDIEPFVKLVEENA